MTIGANRNWRRLAIALTAVAVAGGAVVGTNKLFVQRAKSSETSGTSKAGSQRFTPSDAVWASMAVEPVSERIFRAEHITEGKIAVNEDSSTPIFSPYAGRVTKLLVKPSDVVERGQPLFVIEAADTVQALNDFVAALGALNTARSKLNLAQIVEKRQDDLYMGKAVPLKDWQQAQSDLTTTQNDLRSAETAVEATHNRLRILGRSEDQIAAFQQTRQISADTPISSPISGTVVQRKVGPALPGRMFKSNIDYVSAAIDPSTRRLLVRANIDNKEGLFKPEMFANVTIYAGADHSSVGVPKQALIYEGDRVRLWVAREDKSIELREIETGLTNGNLVEVRTNLKAGEKVITKGSLFIDRAASGT